MRGASRAVLLEVAVFLAAAAVASLSCGGPQSGSAPLDEGDPYAAPSMLTLPTPDVADSELSDKMRGGWALAEESFDSERPPPPPSGEVGDYQAWAEGDLARWLERKSHTVEVARHELDEAAEETHRQRIMAGAIVGLMYEAVARDLRSLPIPAEIEREPEIADVFRSILASQARPYLEHARRAYRACAANAEGGPEGMRHWSGYCATRADALPEADAP